MLSAAKTLLWDTKHWQWSRCSPLITTL
jgi:hypothetical protein